MPIIALDFEASCLPGHGRSYPIEVGIADCRGSECWLIRPHEDWLDWDWSEEAERIHGITRDELLRQGQPVETVASALMAALAGHRVVAGSRIDNYWLHTLTNAAQIPHVAKMEHVENVIDELGCSTAEIMDAQAELDRRGYLLHRAQGDAEWTFGLIEVLKQTAARNRSIGRPAALVPRNSWSNRTQSQNLIGAEF